MLLSGTTVIRALSLSEGQSASVNQTAHGQEVSLDVKKEEVVGFWIFIQDIERLWKSEILESPKKQYPSMKLYEHDPDSFKK